MCISGLDLFDGYKKPLDRRDKWLKLRVVSVFLSFSKGCSSERERRASTPLDASPVSFLKSRAWSFWSLARFARRTKKKERLLVVYNWLNHFAIVIFNIIISIIITCIKNSTLYVYFCISIIRLFVFCRKHWKRI